MTNGLLPFQGAEHLPFHWEGDGSRLAIFVHGFPGTPAEMRPVADAMHARGWSVQGLLLPGFGADFLNLSGFSQADWLKAVHQAVHTARRAAPAGQALILVGNSMGAALALQTAAALPVDGLLLLAPFWRVNLRLADLIFPVAARLVPRLRPFRKADFSDPRFRESVHQIMPDADLDDSEVQAAVREVVLPLSVLAQVRSVGHQGYRHARGVQAPVAIIQGKNDVIAHPTLTRQLAARISTVKMLRLVEGEHDISRMAEPNRAEMLTALDDAMLCLAPEHPLTRQAINQTTSAQ
ncbi:MAG: alpha/beta fold hydrolase [Caldilineaceae bacterium]|nr:alpha/beta fold hydrolase [Caldilineaceae bacterium]